jgi:hypothetical protein
MTTKKGKKKISLQDLKPKHNPKGGVLISGPGSHNPGGNNPSGHNPGGHSPQPNKFFGP